MSTLFAEQAKPAEYDSTSVEYIKCRVEKRINGVVVDPSADVVSMAFTLTKTGTGASFKSADWETTSQGYYIRCLVGPGGGTVTLVAGKSYYVWVKITDSPEIPVKSGGMLAVT
jgi:hypothetical protein